MIETERDDRARLAEGFHGLADPHHAEKRESYFFKDSAEFAALRSAIKLILLFPFNVEWTVQGFGMMRTYLPFTPNRKRFRLNVWDSTLATPNVSTMHDHPWDFTSWIISGAFHNVRFVEDSNGGEYDFMKIMCGECGGARSEAVTIRLRAWPTEDYNVGDIYHQEANEIHVSHPEDHSVTLNDRTGDTEHARVFWPRGLEWVDAKPRPATTREILDATTAALDRWES